MLMQIDCQHIYLRIQLKYSVLNYGNQVTDILKSIVDVFSQTEYLHVVTIDLMIVIRTVYPRKQEFTRYWSLFTSSESTD